jgi:hypothetical protein
MLLFLTADYTDTADLRHECKLPVGASLKIGA